MSLTTFSVFYYDFEIDSDAYQISFDEGAGELTADVDFGSYTPTELAVAIKTAMDATGLLTYTVTFNRADRNFTISSTAAFDLLVSSGASAVKAFSRFGFTGADLTGLSTYTGGESGDAYFPQFILQDHVSSDNWQSLIKPSVNLTASGQVEVIRFGVEKFIQMNIKYITDLANAPDGKAIRKNPTGVADLQRFLQFVTLKKRVEFMPNELARSTFQTVLLETTDKEKDGTGYLLKELYDKGLPNIFETGKLVWRLIE